MESKKNPLFNINELACDLILFTSGILYYFLSDSIIKFIKADTLKLIIAYEIAIFMLPAYMGLVLARYATFKKSILNKILIVVFLIVTITVFCSILWVCSQLKDTYDEQLSLLFVSMGAVLLILGFMFSYLTYSSESKDISGTKEQAAKDEKGISIIIIIALILTCFLMFALFIYSPLKKSNGQGLLEILYFIGVFFGAPIVGVLVIALLIFLKENIIDKVDYKLKKVVTDILFCLFISFSLSILNALVTQFILLKLQLSAAPFFIILLSLILSGILPFRLIILFEPPINLINLVLGAVSFAMYLAGLVRSL